MDPIILELIERRKAGAEGRRANDRIDILPLVMGGVALLLLGFLIGLSLPH